MASRAAGEEGTGPPPHRYDWDEAFYILKGGIHFLRQESSRLHHGNSRARSPRNRAWLSLNH